MIYGLTMLTPACWQPLLPPRINRKDLNGKLNEFTQCSQPRRRGASRPRRRQPCNCSGGSRRLWIGLVPAGERSFFSRYSPHHNIDAIERVKFGLVILGQTAAEYFVNAGRRADPEIEFCRFWCHENVNFHSRLLWQSCDGYGARTFIPGDHYRLPKVTLSDTH